MRIFISLLMFVVIAYAKSLDESNDGQIALFFDVYRDVSLLLSTRSNRGSPFRIAFRNLQSLISSPYNHDKPTRILIHGWNGNASAPVSAVTSEELLDMYDFNVIHVDWGVGAGTINYAAAAGRVESVGFFVASQLKFMRENRFLNFNRLHIIGFSLGAHVAGFIGKNTNGEIDTIIGLDPAGPLFSERRPNGRLDASDARYVECLHTNGGLVGAGIGRPICQADFFPNGGSRQAGCLTNTCSHTRAVPIYVESLQNNGFHATRCESLNEAPRGNCNSGTGYWFGGEPSNSSRKLRGIFHFNTNRSAPFAQGPKRP